MDFLNIFIVDLGKIFMKEGIRDRLMLYLKEAGYFVVFIILMLLVLFLVMNLLGMTDPVAQGSAIGVASVILSYIYIQARKQKLSNGKSTFFGMKLEVVEKSRKE